MARWVWCTWMHMMAWELEGPSGNPLAQAAKDLLGVTYVDRHGCHLIWHSILYGVEDR